MPQLDLSLWEMLANATLAVQLVMGLLVFLSLSSWTLIITKGQTLGRARRIADRFEKRFWAGVDLTDLYSELTKKRRRPSGMGSLFEAGFKEFVRLRRSANASPSEVLSGTQRAMQVVLSREQEQLEEHLSFLATVGSVSPYIGLFGTVWGIMHAFQGLAEVQQATIAMVAPGISEALIATAMGLFAAIPAVVAYNRYATASDRLLARYEAFMDELATLLQRQSLARIDEGM